MATPGLRHPLVSYQPLRFLFQLSYAATILLRLPYYAVIALVPGLRPNRRWTAKQTFMTRLLYPFLDVISRVAITETLTLAPGKEGDRFQTVPPASADAYLGPLASSAAVRPATIGGTWFPHAPTDLRADEKKTVVLYFHGGAFIQGDGRAATCGDLASRLLAARPRGAGADLVFSVQYRLSGCGGANPFPAALQDAVSAYLFLVRTAGVPARRIIVGGDSAGGNLATALLRYLAEFGREIGGGGAEEPPRAALLFSPWVAPFDHDGLAGSARRATDFLPMRFPRWGAEAYAGAGAIPAADADVARPYVTPLGNPFATPVPLFVNAADAELLYEGILRWVAEMRGVGGNAVEVYHEADAVHDTFLAGELLGFEDSAWVVAGKVGEFLGRL